jgi:hypothetical protein
MSVFPAGYLNSHKDGVINNMYAEVVTFAAGSLEAGGLPGYPEVFLSLK